MKIKKYGIGWTTEKNWRIQYGINPKKYPTCLLRDKHHFLWRQRSINTLSGRQLFNFEKTNIDFYITLRSYRGLRHRNNYPVRGQRTHTNANMKKKRLPDFK